MTDKVLLAVYAIEIYRGADSQLPGKFGGNVDLLTLFDEFVDFVFKSARFLPGAEGKKSHRFTYCNHTLPKLDTDTRELYGFFYSGRDGDRFNAAKYSKNSLSNEPELEANVTSDMFVMRDSFFYLKVPQGVGKKRAYLILQRADGEGIKGLVLHFLLEFMRSKGLQDFRIITRNLVPDKLFKNMLDDGFFKELTLVRYGVPPIMEKSGNKDNLLPVKRGKVKLIYQATDLGDNFKEWGLKALGGTKKSKFETQDTRVVVEVGGQKEAYDEVSMLLELNGKKKTFHLSNNNLTQPDVDVTKSVRYNEHGRLRLDHLLEQARELVTEASLDIAPNDIAS
jgi:hypothetical protein